MVTVSRHGLFDIFKEHLALLIEPCNRSFLYLAMMYAVAVSLLTLAVPISVQMLINTVANIASIQAITILSLILFGLLLFSGLLTAFQTYTLELFERRFYASMTAQFTMRNMQADQQAFRQINGNDLINRYFDIMQVQKVVPSLISGFFAIMLQMLVGIVLVSFYHPWLFLFNVLFVLSLWLVWRVWGTRAMYTALQMSEAKYMTARHLEDVAQSNDFYKSSTRGAFAVSRTNELTGNYLDKRKRHFRNTFSQQISLLFLYALASAALLGIGGILVVRSELTLGQLVAAELILSAVFFAISRLNYYLVQFYELSAALEEIHRVYEVKLEDLDGKRILQPSQNNELIFEKICTTYGTQHLTFEHAFHHNEKVMIKASASAIQRCMADLLKRYAQPRVGSIRLNGEDISEYTPGSLRNQVIVIDRSSVIETRVIDYLRIHAPEASRADILAMLDLMELHELIDRLPDGIDTRVLANGMPLKSSELLRLKLAGALLAQPSVLVLNEYFDTLSYHRRQRIFGHICSRTDMIVLYFSNRQDLYMFDRYLYVDWNSHKAFADVTELRNCDLIDETRDAKGCS